MAIKQIDYGTNEYKQMVQLRDDVLRKPLGLSFSDQDLERDKNDILIVAMDDDEILGCCILTPEDDQKIRLRQMAVKKSQQGTGVGEQIMNFAEILARDKGFQTLIMHARDTAIGFYEKLGYKVHGDGFEEVTIPHHKMAKFLM